MKNLNCLYLIMAVLITACIGLGLTYILAGYIKPQLPRQAILETVELVYGSKVEEGTAQVSEDLAKYVKWGFNYPDRGIVLVVKTVNDFSKNRVYIRGHEVSRKASLLIMNREMIKRVRRE